MLPIQDNIRARSTPFMNYAIILASALVFFLKLGLEPPEVQAIFMRFGAVPERVLADPTLGQIGTLFSSMFLHGSWFHLLTNMWALFIFGDNIQDCMGPWRYLFFYLTAGLIAVGLHVMLNPDSSLPVIGASGAIAGVMGAYLILYPRARVFTLLLIGLPWFIQIPAVVYFGIWFITQILQGLMSLGVIGMGAEFGGVAWWSHVGGFATGLILVWFLRDRESIACRYDEEYSPW